VSPATDTFRYRGVAEHRTDVLVESALVLGNIIVAVWLVDRHIPAYWHLDRALSLTVSFVIVQTVLIAVLLTTMFGLKFRSELRARAGKKDIPVVVEMLTAISRGEKTPEDLTVLYRRIPLTVEKVLAGSLSVQKGAGYERLAVAAETCGALRSWKAGVDSPSAAKRCESVLHLAAMPFGTATDELTSALDDAEELVAVEAGRALLAKGSPAEAEMVFDSLGRQSVLVRALSVSSLRRHATALVAKALPAALQSTDNKRVLVALVAIATWKRLLPLEEIRAVLSHPESEIRVAAFKALPFVMTTGPVDAEIKAGLTDTVESVRAAAALAAGRKSATALVPDLVTLMKTGGEAGREAAIVLTVLGEAAVSELEKAVLTGGTVGAVATEALERFRLGRGWL
jgi:hypothetical protein